MVKPTYFYLIFSILLVCAGCEAGEKSLAENEASTPMETQVKQPAAPPGVETPAAISTNFDDFYEQFSDAINSGNWNALVDMTQFPFVFRGQLDDEGIVEVDKSTFIRVIPKFIDLEAFITLDGDAIPSTYRGLLMTRMEGMESIEDTSADIHDFTFKKIDNNWKFVQVYTDLSNLKTIME